MLNTYFLSVLYCISSCRFLFATDSFIICLYILSLRANEFRIPLVIQGFVSIFASELFFYMVHICYDVSQH